MIQPSCSQLSIILVLLTHQHHCSVFPGEEAEADGSFHGDDDVPPEEGSEHHSDEEHPEDEAQDAEAEGETEEGGAEGNGTGDGGHADEVGTGTQIGT